MLRRSWSKLPPSSMQSIYRKALLACSSDRGQSPPRVIQELVLSWKLLRQ